MTTKTDEELAQFDWLDLRKSLDEAPAENAFDKLIRKCKENPFVPIGSIATTAALSYGLWSFRSGKQKTSQYMMRTRVFAQGFTILAVIGGYLYGIDKIDKK